MHAAISPCIPESPPSPTPPLKPQLMNEIEAEASGTVVKILVENGDAVLPGQPLFIIKP